MCEERISGGDAVCRPKDGKDLFSSDFFMLRWYMKDFAPCAARPGTLPLDPTALWKGRPETLLCASRRFMGESRCKVPLLTFPPSNVIVPPEISVDGEEPAMRRAERGPLGARVLRQAAAVPLPSRPG